MPNNGSPWLVATACDDRYLWPWACAIHSAVLNATLPIRVILANVNGLLSPSACEAARAYFELLGVKGEVVDLTIDVGGVQRYEWNSTVYADLALSDRLEERFLWLDSDTILNPDWTSLFSLADGLMENPDIVACGVVDRSATLDWLGNSGTNTAYLAAKGAYINAGVIIVDPQRWHREGCDREWSDLVTTQKERGFVFPDQDVLNLLLVGKIALLPPKFNHIVSEPADGTESILHFAGFPKPWRLTPAGRALHIATEVANFERPNNQIWGGGPAWELFPRYWHVERDVIARLESSGHRQLARTLISHRDAQLTPMSLQQRVKFRGMRLLAKDYFRNFSNSRAARY